MNFHALNDFLETFPVHFKTALDTFSLMWYRYTKLIRTYTEKENLSSPWGNWVDRVAKNETIQIDRLKLGPSSFTTISFLAA